MTKDAEGPEVWDSLPPIPCTADDGWAQVTANRVNIEWFEYGKSKSTGSVSGPRGLPDKLLKSYPRAAGPATTVRPTSARTTRSAGSFNHALSPAAPTQNFGLGAYRISRSGSALTAECLKFRRSALPDKVVCMEENQRLGV